MGVSGPHAGAGIYPAHRPASLCRRLHDQLGIECVSRHPWAHLRPAVRAGLPAHPGRGKAGRDLPAEACCGRPERRYFRPPAETARQKERQAGRAIGAGPASLTVARDLVAIGYQCVLFDQDKRGGGLMRTNIPAFRLPVSVLDEEVDRVLDLGIEARFGHRIESLKALRDEGFDAIFIGTGAPRGKDLASPAVRKPPPTSISASIFSLRSRSAMSTRSANASSSLAAAILRWIAAARRCDWAASL